MKTKLIVSRVNEHSGFGAGSGDTEYYEYECPCGKGKIIEEHDNIPGFREHDVTMYCDVCNKLYDIDISNGKRNWSLIRKECDKMKSEIKTQPYICRIHIKNFRNFHSVDFNLNDKQVIIGENAVGKSNLLYALQLILDPNMSEKDRVLEETDFWDGLKNPMENGEEILIEIYIANYEDNENLMAQLSDASVVLDGEERLKITYKFFQKDTSNHEYSYIIFKGQDETRSFTYEDRKMLNIRVVKAIRDVETEMRNSRTSPLTQLIKQKYCVSKEVLSEISKSLDEKGADTLHIGQVSDLENRIQSLLNDMVSFSANEFHVALRTMNIDATRLLYALRPIINDRETLNTSLGINNVLYIALILLLIEDDTIKTYLSGDLYRELIELDTEKLIEQCYTKSAETDEYVLNLTALKDGKIYDGLYKFFSGAIPTSSGVTILAVEEPESHLHPIYQRLLYRHIINKSNTSVMVTTHSTYVSSVAPITAIVHLLNAKGETSIKTTADIKLSESDFSDLSRYIDVKRGELYTAKGVIFVEGIAEEYLLPSFAKLQGADLDRLGVVVCNINSTNFKPYCDFVNALGIPYVIVTDGDYYHIVDEKKCFGELENSQHVQKGYDGLERLHEMYGENISINYEELDIESKRKLFADFNAFIGEYTLEVDILKKSNEDDKNLICSLFNQLTQGGDRQKENFASELKAGEYNKCLSKIESSHSRIGKGRFAQRLAEKVTSTMIPDYISNAIDTIAEKVR